MLLLDIVGLADELGPFADIFFQFLIELGIQFGV